ncbi:MAG: PEGA domain-containing protein [Candidatus Omnitrophota bacterium]|nr:PEGA domain-containing protein [Candidatus Omnitrophota bacterium]
MNKSDSIIRYVAFYFSLALYFILLPIVLSYSLGYHIDFYKFKIYKTGILSLTSTPAGATIYINGRLYKDITPVRIEELKPGDYLVEVKREGFYPWQKNLSVIPNMVTRADNIILFPTLRDIAKLCVVDTIDFAIPDSKNQIYHMTKSGLYRSNIDGTNLKKLSDYSDWPDYTINKRFSPDGKKMLYFNKKGIWVIYLDGRYTGKEAEYAEVEEVLRDSGIIKEAFWHSGSNHIVFVEDKDINVLELGKGREKNMVTLHKCGKVPQGLYYDESNDSLYFSDMRNERDCVLRLDLREKFFDKLLQRVKKELDIIYEQKK